MNKELSPAAAALLSLIRKQGLMMVSPSTRWTEDVVSLLVGRYITSRPQRYGGFILEVRNGKWYL